MISHLRCIDTAGTATEVGLSAYDGVPGKTNNTQSHDTRGN
jgi:hypothetical protein